MLEPEYLISDYTKIQDNDTVHIAFQTINEFKKKHSNNLPRAWNKKDAESFVKLAEKLNSSLKKPFNELNKTLLELFSSVCTGKQISQLLVSLLKIVSPPIIQVIYAR